MNAIIIGLNGLHIAALGCYGNSVIETPRLDQFATEGFVFDQYFNVNPCLIATRRCWWTGEIPSKLERVGTKQKSGLSQLLSSGIICTALIRDTEELCQEEIAETAYFGKVTTVQWKTTESISLTLEAAQDCLNQNQSDQAHLLFLDCHGAHPPLGPPESLVALYKEQEHETKNPRENEVASVRHPTEFTDVQSKLVDKRDVYAAVVTYLDEQIGLFFDFLKRCDLWDRTMVLLTTDSINRWDTNSGIRQRTILLKDRLIHVPLVIHLPGTLHGGIRSQALVQSTDLLPTILDTMGVRIDGHLQGTSLLPLVRQERIELRDYVFVRTDGEEKGIRTAHWYFLKCDNGATSSDQSELYIKPEDRWDRNNVAREYPEIVERFDRLLQDCTVAEQGPNMKFPPLPSELRLI